MFGVKAARTGLFQIIGASTAVSSVIRDFYGSKGIGKCLLLHFQLPNFAETLRSKGLVLPFAAKTDMFAATLVFGGFAVIFIQSE